MLAAETKKPAAGGGAAGFSENNRTATGRRSVAVPANALGRRSRRLHIEPTREEVHQFDNDTIPVLRAY
jgi:hypothetical protein